LTELLTTPATYVWSVAVDKSGTAYVGTASPATVLRVGPDGKPFTLFETKDLSVQVVPPWPDGALYAATLPSGKVYRLKPDAIAKQDDSGLDGKGANGRLDAAILDGAAPLMARLPANLLAAKRARTKARTRVQTNPKPNPKLNRTTSGDDLRRGWATLHRHWRTGSDLPRRSCKAGVKPELFFKSDEEHIRSLAWDVKRQPNCRLGRLGLVYRISPQGKGYVLFEAPRREITSVAVAANGTIYAASVGNKSHNPLPPLPVQRGRFPHHHHRPAGLAGGGKHQRRFARRQRDLRAS